MSALKQRYFCRQCKWTINTPYFRNGADRM